MLPDEVDSNSIISNQKRRVLVCQHTSCLRHGAGAVLEAFQQQSVSGVTVECSGCQGQCNMGPTVRVLSDETWYCRIQPEDVTEIVEQHLQQGQPVSDKLNPRIHARYYGY